MLSRSLHLAFAATLGLAGLSLPSAAQARPIRLSVALQAYGGDGAYLAVYLTDPQGKFHSTLSVSGPKSKYHKHLGGWFRGTGGRFDGITGASVGSGQTLRVSVEIADALIDAGYQIRVDSAVEKDTDVAADVVATLAKAEAGKPIAGKGFVKSLTFDM